MLREHESVAVALLVTSISKQKSDRSKESIVEGNVVKYGRKGFRVSDEAALATLFGKLYAAPESITPERDGALCLAIMSRGLKDQQRRGWGADEIESFTVREYAARLSPAISEQQLRAFVQYALMVE